MMSTPTTNTVESKERFRRHLLRAHLADLFALITGANTDLVRYDEVAKRLRARQQIEAGTQFVPIAKIVGSVGRYQDFTRTFLPRTNVNQERWARVDTAMNSLEGVPPIELFKIGDVYFVRDGNHRISVARANGSTHIEAYVTEVKTDIPLTIDDFTRDQWLIKAEHADFLAQTHLNELRPDADIFFTEPGRYEILLRHIEVHRYLYNERIPLDQPHLAMDWEQAVMSWYDTVYMPVIEAIREYHILDHFPERTEADLYLWIVHHRERLAQHYGLAPLSPEEAVFTFVETHSELPLERGLQAIRQGLHRTFWDDEVPLGLTEEEFLALRARHAAGEVSLAEAEERRASDSQTES
ncbi:MAG: hypothetical protein KDE47_11635 [Caldilineaceae bacterium]|nr:hypothetical protein [Caldilineaceae bacterium]MCB0097399.1 hypothetical protein [Caldilineaceae bacterium]MCB9155969.1 hypothetical protein [Caldilineaceae bacterium]